jgi:uncharacterized membrane protein YkvA (DUF1232 family)
VSVANENDTSGSALHRLGTRSARTITAVLRDIRCLYFVFRNPATPWYARALLFLPLASLCSPIQLIPNFIPVLGQMDDLFVIWISTKLLRRLVDPTIVAACRERAAAASFSIKFSGKSFYPRPVTSDAEADGPAQANGVAATTAPASAPAPSASRAAQ